MTLSEGTSQYDKIPSWRVDGSDARAGPTTMAFVIESTEYLPSAAKESEVASNPPALRFFAAVGKAVGAATAVRVGLLHAVLAEHSLSAAAAAALTPSSLALSVGAETETEHLLLVKRPVGATFRFFSALTMMQRQRAKSGTNCLEDQRRLVGSKLVQASVQLLSSSNQGRGRKNNPRNADQSQTKQAGSRAIWSMVGSLYSSTADASYLSRDTASKSSGTTLW
mmetsp:Transcript_27768/g.60895  ORF Transcript_27768/g.60895 Transcript_27768/m.60895 type:complete len:224 (-) Transcript_27768:82-753(-)